MITLTKIERQVLLNKYMKSGLNFHEALAKLDLFHDKLKELRNKLRSKGNTEESIENKFKEEFYSLCQRLER